MDDIFNDMDIFLNSSVTFTLFFLEPIPYVRIHVKRQSLFLIQCLKEFKSPSFLRICHYFSEEGVCLCLQPLVMIVLVINRSGRVW